MEELRSASMAYYKNSSKKLKKKAKKFFRSMDANRDDRVSLAEFASFLQQKGYGEIEHNMFRQLDANGDGELDFDEVLTFYYIVKTRGLWCDVCHSRLTGLHFSCVTCFENGRNSFDLCSSCYGNGRFNHPHNIFLDSHVLLRSKKGRPGADVNMALTQPQLPPQPHNHSNWVIAPFWCENCTKLVFMVGDGLTIAGLTGGCSIM
ncbi:hypothetical protein UlMin_010080 [Ulmus minor]